MTSIKRHKVILESTGAVATGEWFELDVRYEEAGTRILQVQVTTGDTITIQGITQDVKGIDKSFLDDLVTADITSISAITTTDDYLLEGPWRYIRAVKTGTTGPAKVQGFI